MDLSFASETVLQKAALDEGFDIELGAANGWLRFESTQTPLRIALAPDAETPGAWCAAISLPETLAALARESTAAVLPAPPGYAGVLRVPRADSLHALLRRARLLGRALPTAPLDRFARDAGTLPRTTEAERLVVQRVGQGIFREALLDFWGGRCPISLIDDPALLRASHMKPWARCASDAERLDVHNGLLLAAHLDAAFDAGLISFRDDGCLLASPRLSAANAERLGLGAVPALPFLPAHLPYLRWHRERELRA